MRSIPASVRAQMFAPETSGLYPALLEITHGVAGYENPLRIVNNTVDLVYNGATYYAFPFKYNPPDQSKDSGIASAKLTICAVDQQIAAILRSTETAPTVKAVACFWNDAGGTVLFEPIASWPLTLRNVTGDMKTISAELILEEHLDNQIPGRVFRAALFPGLF